MKTVQHLTIGQNTVLVTVAITVTKRISRSMLPIVRLRYGYSYYDCNQQKPSITQKMSGFINWTLLNIYRLFPQRPTVNKSLWFIYAGNVTVTKSGFKAMPASSVPLSGNKETQSQFLSTCIAPAEVVKGSNLQQQMYCHLLCGLSKFEIIDSILQNQNCLLTYW